MKHLVFIINPHSGVDRQKAIQQAIETNLDTTQFSWEIQHTQHAGHGTELAKLAADNNAFAVVAVGGDGSVNDVAKGLVGSHTALAIIPKGSGNGMARSLNIPLKVEQAISVINGNNTIMMDLGFVNEYSFISNAGVGFDTIVSQQFASSKKRGLMVYAWLTIKNLLSYNELDWQLTVDDITTTERAFIINVANGKQFGYNFQIAPDASWTDGLFDVIIIRKFPKLLGFTIAWRALRGTIHHSPYVRVVRGKKVTISHPSLQYFQTDGDAQPAKNPLQFNIEPAVLKVVVP